MAHNTDKISKAYEQFFQAMARNNLQKLAESAYEILGYPVLVNDNVGSNLVQFPNKTIGDEDWDQLYETKISPFTHYSHFWEKHVSLSREYPILISDGHKEKTDQIFSILKKNNQIIGFTSFLMPDASSFEEDKDVVQLFNMAVTHLIATREETEDMAERWSRQLLNELLTMPGQSSKAFFNNVHNLSVQYKAPYAIFIIQWKENITRDNYTESLYTQLCKRFPDALCTKLEDRIIILGSKITMRGMAVNCPILLDMIKKYPVKISISSPFTELLDVRGCYQQALLTMQMGLQTAPQKDVYRAENYTPLQVFAAFSNHYSAKPFIHPILKKISEHDTEHGTEYLHTLRLYLFCMLNKKDAANMLHIHSNTLLYRINQIQTLFDIDFRNYYLLNTLVASFGLVIASGAHYPSYMPDVNPDAIPD